MCSDKSFVENLTVEGPFATSDHHIIRFSLVVNKEVGTDCKISNNYFKADYNKIREYVKSREWENLIDNSDIEKSWTAIKEELLNVRNNFVPTNKQNKNKCKWVTKEVARCRRAKKKAWNNYVKSGKNLQLYQQYVNKRKQCTAVNKKQ